MTDKEKYGDFRMYQAGKRLIENDDDILQTQKYNLSENAWRHTAFLQNHFIGCEMWQDLVDNKTAEYVKIMQARTEISAHWDVCNGMPMTDSQYENRDKSTKAWNEMFAKNPRVHDLFDYKKAENEARLAHHKKWHEIQPWVKFSNVWYRYDLEKAKEQKT